MPTPVSSFGYAILVHKPYTHHKRIHWTLGPSAISWSSPTSSSTHPKTLLTPMKFLRRNLASINQLLQSAEELQNPAAPPTSLPPGTAGRPAPAGIAQAAPTPNSMVFRHALRLSLGLVVGCGILQVFHLDKGYWILLTVLFVCQPSYSATRRRLVQRMLGTFAGIPHRRARALVLPELHLQLGIMGPAAFLFFTQVRSNYSAAVCFITLYVLMAFNLLDGIGFAILGPRLLDTLLGCLLSYALVAWLWPDWQVQAVADPYRQLLSANAKYLSAVSPACIANGTNPWTTGWPASAPTSPTASWPWPGRACWWSRAKRRRFLDLCFALTWRNHALLSHISALQGPSRQTQSPSRGWR